jgi:hypothetical protein
MTTLRSFRKVLGGVLLCAASAITLAAPPSLAMLGFELLEEHPDAAQDAAQQARLAMIDQQFRALIEEKGLYHVVDLAPHHDLIAEVRDRSEFIYRCQPCKRELGAGIGAEYVAVGWVQKVSNLILNVNIEIREVASDRVALVKSVDMRGNNDESWTRAVRFMVRDMDERRERNPRYGL